MGGTLCLWRKEVHHAKNTSPYPLEFRRQMVALVRSGRTPSQLATTVGVVRACQVLGVSRVSLYRHRARVHKPRPDRSRDRRLPTRALKEQERAQILDVLNSERFQDAAPRQVLAQLLDEGTYLCSWHSMYRILEAHDPVRERRNQLSHPTYKKSELLVQGANLLWS